MIKTILIIFGIIFLALQYHLWFSHDGVFKIFRLKHEINIQQTKNKEISKINENLIKDISVLKQGGTAIENRARNDLGMVKKGEIFYQIVK